MKNQGDWSMIMI